MGVGGWRTRPVMAFVHIQKTAGTSLITILRNSFGIGHLEVRTLDRSAEAVFSAADLAVVTRVSPWVKSICGHEIVEPTAHLPDRFLPYTILREPVARTLSHFEDKQRRGREPPTLEAFLADPANHNFQVRKIAGGEDLEKAKRLLAEAYLFVGVQERFDESVRALAALAPWRMDLRYMPSNVFESREIRDRLRADHEVMARFREINAMDTELHEWVSRELYPAFLAKAGNPPADPLPTLPPGRRTLRYRASRFWQRSAYRYALKVARALD